jgi:hypothetical protein
MLGTVLVLVSVIIKVIAQFASYAVGKFNNEGGF